MQTLPTIVSPWYWLKKGEVSCEEALSILIDEQGIVNLDVLDKEVSSGFFGKSLIVVICLPSFLYYYGAIAIT
jgi:general secretion pathway protein E